MLSSARLTAQEANEELKQVKKDIRRKAVEKVEKNFLLNALIKNDWNVTRAAEKTGLQRTNFQSLMKKHGIITNDLHTLTKTFAADQFDGPGNVHYTQEGYQKIGQQVTDHILIALEGEQQEPGDKE